MGGEQSGERKSSSSLFSLGEGEVDSLNSLLGCPLCSTAFQKLHNSTEGKEQILPYSLEMRQWNPESFIQQHPRYSPMKVPGIYSPNEH